MLVCTIGVGTAFVLGQDSGPSHPDEWAAGVLPFVEIVEDERGLDFEHPVHVEFLPDAEFSADVTAEETELTEEDQREIEQFTGLLRALGLVRGDLDLFEATNDLMGEGILGYYSYDDERIRMRGEELTPAVRSTLVHELTHALQDQHFDLGARLEDFDESDDLAGRTAFEALVEGDASRIETAYRASLSDEDRATLDEAQAEEVEAFESGTTEVPEILSTFVGAPYALGEALLQLALETDGNDAVDDLFDDPPSTDEHLFDPWTLIADDDEALEVAEPVIADGEEEFDRGPFGALTWYLMLAERLDPVTALDATDGWGGDAYVAFDREGSTCARVRYRADTPEDLEEMEAALRSWIDAGGDAPASVDRAGDELVFESCDPGSDADVGSDSSEDAIGLALARTYIAIDFLEGSGDEDASRCFANGLVHTFTLDQLNDPTLDPDDPEIVEQVQTVAIDCL